MKKYIGAALLLLAIPIFAHADIDDPLVIQGKTCVLHISTTIGTNINPTSTLYISDLISLSTTTGLFPHQETGEIDISGINVFIDKIVTTTGAVRIGVVNYISPSSGSVTWIYNNTFIKNSSFTIIPFNNYAPAFYRCRVRPNGNSATMLKDGLTPYLLSTDVTSGSTAYTSTNTLNSPILNTGVSSGTVVARVGDIVMEAKVFDATNTFSLIADIFYHSERP